jgi:hypothetical protein
MSTQCYKCTSAMCEDCRRTLDDELTNYFKLRADRIEQETGIRPDGNKRILFIDTDDTFSMWE